MNYPYEIVYLIVTQNSSVQFLLKRKNEYDNGWQKS